MVIHCLDDRKDLPTKDVEALFGVMSLVQTYAFKKYGVEKPLHGKLFMQAVIENADRLEAMGEKFDKRKMVGLLQKRGENDRPLAESMRKAAGSDMGATLFGAGHAKGEDGLFDSLGQETTLRVDLHSSRDFYADRLFSSRERGIEPHYIHILNEDRLFRVRKFG